MGYSMDRAVFAIAATATLPVGQFWLLLHTNIRTMGMAVFVIAATATLPVGHFQQHMHTPIHPMNRAVFVIGATQNLQMAILSSMYTGRFGPWTRRCL